MYLISFSNGVYTKMCNDDCITVGVYILHCSLFWTFLHPVCVEGFMYTDCTGLEIAVIEVQGHL